MEQNIFSLSLERIMETVPGLKYCEAGLLVTDSSHGCFLAETDFYYFRYPLRIDGVIIVLPRTNRIEGMVNFHKRVLDERQMLICRPGDIVQVDASEERPRTMIISPRFLQEIQIDVKAFVPAFVRLNSNPVFTLTEAQKEELVFYHDLLERNMDNDGPYRIEILQRLLAVYLFKIGEILKLQCIDEASAVKAALGREEQIFNDFITLLAKHHFTERRVEYYADALFLSPKYFSSAVKKASGRTAGEWIDVYVVQEAKSLLKYSDLSIQEIAYHLNFATPSFFGKYFKQHTGMSPGEYRVLR